MAPNALRRRGVLAKPMVRAVSPQSASVYGPRNHFAPMREWSRIGTSHIYLDTMRAGFGTVAEHIDAITRFKTRLDELGM